MSMGYIFNVSKYRGDGSVWWSKFAKDSIRDTYASGSLYWDAQPAARFSAIVQMCKVVAELVYNDLEEYNHIVDKLGGEISRLKIKRNYQSGELSPGLQTVTEEVDILNPDVVRTKGCGAMPNGTPSNQR
ncbi:protein FAR1-RELATED SEQUENCE 5-like, partial [Trifolium medium]|nr:protein FAR1-RELATED SEQUENCE 5-like [Trifolium medium]